jgi:hypothetical protein
VQQFASDQPAGRRETPRFAPLSRPDTIDGRRSPGHRRRLPAKRARMV